MQKRFGLEPFERAFHVHRGVWGSVHIEERLPRQGLQCEVLQSDVRAVPGEGRGEDIDGKRGIRALLAAERAVTRELRTVNCEDRLRLRNTGEIKTGSGDLLVEGIEVERAVEAKLPFRLIVKIDLPGD